MTRYQGSGVNSSNDTAREASSKSFTRTLHMQRQFGSQSEHRKTFLDKYQWSMTWTQYKRMVSGPFAEGGKYHKRYLEKYQSQMTWKEYKKKVQANRRKRA